MCKRMLRGIAAMLVVLSILMGMPASATPITDYEHNQQQQGALQGEIGENRAEIDRLQAERAEFQAELDGLTMQVAVLQGDVEALDVRIAELQDRLDFAHQELDDKLTAYSARVRAIEEYGTSSYWAIIFSATSLTDLLGRIDYVNEVMESDVDIMADMERNVAGLDTETEELANLRADRRFAVGKLKQAQHSLSDKIQARMDVIDSIQEVNNAYAQELAQLQALSELLLSQIQKLDYQRDEDIGTIFRKYVVETGDIEKSTLGAEIVRYTLQFLGGEYVWGGATPGEGFDCSGMMYYVYAQYGYSLQRTSSMQFAYSGYVVSRDTLQPGDMVFFHPPGENYVSHVGMYMGGGMFIHAASRSSGIKISSLYSDYYTNNFHGARRIIE